MTRKIKVGNIYIGGDSPITVQSMCDTKTEDIESTVEQILALENLGCDIIRVAVNNDKAAKSIKEIKKNIHIPLVADIQYDYKLAVKSVENGIDKVRINPGNIGSSDKVKYLADIMNERNIPIRIGVNTGSLDKEFKNVEKTKALVKSAEKHIKILENAGFYNIIVSLKSSDVMTTIEANRLFSKTFDYPLHIGVTEAGGIERGLIKNSLALGALLTDGVGDTIRLSLSDSPEQEVISGRMLLKSLKLNNDSEVVSCPTCSRTEIDVKGLSKKVEELICGTKGLKVAVMGCVVNGVGEGEDADIGVAGGREKSVIFEKGKIIKTVNNDVILDELKTLIDKCKVKNEKI